MKGGRSGTVGHFGGRLLNPSPYEGHQRRPAYHDGSE